ncbi:MULTISPECIES: polyhydroxyalkanoic acid system family protein [Aeromonas]|uniref:Polyhydroxyalkanoic acid system family protein n=7 Tax=Bacteria TaxID=2 RepID=A0AAQ0W0W7_AERSA|nr:MULTISPECIES: polyhydroxyalkanoic acid system family protein [Aeromonas]AYO63157.1 poly(3-hydroxybutyrate) depolymerase [Aeromonas salmonicida subsp. salmonicida 01-B526]ELI6430541.1 polyhydroxyalkanoic acid system family protein [Aeromonas salmonicida subsp. salmonicida]MBP6450589.1 polyhydroxyalkanoic acid system family protein [Aeromonas sp.]TMX09556.1 poly(3-hydroxybutyrate) depolymerase [Aeromonas salmonicida subsp. achromogenes]ASI23375.1 poly(3-hydroxybutyrate) depolymerase [Aeromona
MCLISINVVIAQRVSMFLYDPLVGSSLSTIQVNRQHPLGLAGVRLAAEAIAQDMSEEYQLDCEWEDEEETRLLFRGAGVNGFLCLTDTNLQLEVRLGLMLLPVRSVLEQEILEYVDNRLPCPSQG